MMKKFISNEPFSYQVLTNGKWKNWYKHLIIFPRKQFFIYKMQRKTIFCKDGVTKRLKEQRIYAFSFNRFEFFWEFLQENSYISASDGQILDQIPDLDRLLNSNIIL